MADDRKRRRSKKKKRDSSRSEDDSGRRSRRKDSRRSRGRGGKGFKYKKRSKEDWQRRSEQSGYSRRSMFKEDVTVFRPKEGDNLIRILPPTWDDADHYGYEIWCHYRIGPDGDAFLDRNEMLGEPDPIAEERIRAMQEGDKEYADKLKSKKRVCVYIIDRDEPEKGVQLWAMPWTLDADITTLAVDKRSGEVLNIDDPENGYDVEFTKSGKGVQTQYTGVAISRRSEPLDDDEALEAAVETPIPDTLLYYDYDEIKKVFSAGGSGYDEDDEEEEEEKSSRKSRRKKKSSGSKSKRKYEDDDEDDEEEETPDMPSYSEVQEMEIDELYEVIDEHQLDVDDDIDEDDDDQVNDLKDDVCKELGLKPPAKRRAKRSERKKLRRRGRGSD